MSWQARLLTLWLRHVERPALARIAEPEAIRRRFEWQARWVFPVKRGVQVAPVDLGGVPGLRVGARPAPATILHLHGGAYVFGSARTHLGLAGALYLESGLPVVLPEYRCAPEAPFPAAFDDARAAYLALVEAGQKVVLGGDSAGGGLALALLASIVDEKLPQPILTYGFSPFTDMTYSGASIEENAMREVLLPVERIGEVREMYLQGADPRDPRASPLFAAFAGAAGPVALWGSGAEILRDDARRMAERLRCQGVEVRLQEQADLPHASPYFVHLLPEARQTVAGPSAQIGGALTQAA